MSNECRGDMVGWYDPSQLVKTGKKTLISTIIGENADPRLIAASAGPARHFDYSTNLTSNNNDFDQIPETERDEIWIDYVSDVGDGWNSTYSVAYSLAQQQLNVARVQDPLQRGEILIFGGDQVYPTASVEEYENRLVKPYEMAFNSSRSAGKNSLTHEVDLKQDPHVFCIPGNHDWYDSLASFQNIFCNHFFNRRRFAGSWRTRQTRSYFALKLPHNWWLFGVDFQLSHDVDVQQLRYFENVTQNHVKNGDKIILCVPEPYWVKVIKYEGLTDKFKEKEKSVDCLARLIKDRDAQIRLYLAGDLHHYRRFEAGGVHKITAGGGGAFLHPTHDHDFEEDSQSVSQRVVGKGFLLKSQYPDYSTSKSLGWSNFYGFTFKNARFGLATAILYVFLAWMVSREPESLTLREAITSSFQALFDKHSLAGFLTAITLIAFYVFTDSNSKWYRGIAGTLHGVTHIFAMFVLGWLGYLLHVWINNAYQITSPTINLLTWFASVTGVAGLGGYLIGSIIMGLYLGISLQFFQRHDNEAFSALKIEDYKNFLRIHINKEGKLTVYPLKIDKVEREWTHDTNNGWNYCRPKNKLKQELIESPIVIN